VARILTVLPSTLIGTLTVASVSQLEMMLVDLPVLIAAVAQLGQAALIVLLVRRVADVARAAGLARTSALGRAWSIVGFIVIMVAIFTACFSRGVPLVLVWRLDGAAGITVAAVATAAALGTAATLAATATQLRPAFSRLS
jgi:riboflavin transporter FmnP